MFKFSHSVTLSSVAARVLTVFAGAALVAGTGLLAGCPSNSNNEQTSAPPVARAAGFHGVVFGGRQPIQGATVVAYAAGTVVGAVPTQIGTAVTSGPGGSFTMTFSPAPTTGELIYVVAKGGIAYTGGSANPAIGLMTVAGIQGSTLAPIPATVNIDELTTVAATAALKDYIQFADCSTITGSTQSGTCVSIPGALDLGNMAATFNNLADPVTGQASGFLTSHPSALGTTLEKLDTLANVLAACVNGSGPTAGVCTGLFAAALGNPADTLKAAYLVAASPIVNSRAGGVYALAPTAVIYSPVLTAAPSPATQAGFWTVGGTRYAYTANFGSDNASGFRLGHGDGALTAVAAGVCRAAPDPHNCIGAGTTPLSVAVDPTGRYVYVANYSSNSVSAYRIGAGGALTAVAGSPFPTGALPGSVAVDSTGHYLYVVNTGDKTVSAYTINQNSGVLTQISGSPYTGGYNPQAVVANPTGPYLYVVSRGKQFPTFYYPSRVFTYTIGAGGKLTLDPNSPATAGKYPSSIAIDPTGRYLYVTNTLGDDVSAYTINQSNGLPTPVPAGACGSSDDPSNCFAAGGQPHSVTVDPTGRYVYVTNWYTDNVSAYTINQATGGLTTVAGSPFAGVGLYVQSVAVDPTGRYVYVTNYNVDNVGGVLMYAINQVSGALAAVAAGPCGTTPDPHNCIGAGTVASAIAVDPLGRYVYVTNHDSNNVSAYTIGAGTALAQVSGSPFGAGSGPASVAVDPTGRYVYVVNHGGDDTISAYTLGAGGLLAQVSGSPFAAGSGAGPVTVDPSGRYVYVANENSNNVSAYALGADGSLAQVPGSPFAAGATPISVAVDPAGDYVYVANRDGNDVSAYTINQSNGALIALSADSCGTTPDLHNCIGAGTKPLSVTVDPSGRTVYVANKDSGNVSVYTIGTGGTLAEISGSPFAAGGLPASVTVDPTGRYVYVANQADDSVSAYTIGDGGALTPVSGSPFATGDNPKSVVVDPTGHYVYVANLHGNTVSVYAIGTGGALTEVSGSPFAAGTLPESVAVGP